ncbi:MAG: peptide chain release factor-like protein [bacterium]|nr:peptide chain release factor-like protein [bacterium]
MSLYNTDLEALQKEVEITPFRGSGPGGQHRNKVESAVRLVHLPSGITIVAAEHRSQHRNRELALERLREKLIQRNRRKKPRISTRPSRASRARRLEKKRQQARKKNLRRRMPPDS